MDLKTQIIQEYLTQGVGFIAVVGRLTNNTLAHHSRMSPDSICSLASDIAAIYF
jgi:hypothetical protein